MNLSERSWNLIFALICLFYVLIRLWNLTDSCLWFDEIFSIHAAEHSWLSMFWFVAQDLIHPPFFYFLLKIWIQIGGESVFWLRLFPVLFSTAALIPFYLLCKQLKLTNTAIAFALTFFAVNGSLIKYAQEVRMYSVLLCLSLFSMWIFLRFLEKGKGFWILTFINILLVYTHYFGWLVIFSEILAILILQRGRIWQLMKSIGLTIFSFIPWLFLVLQASRLNADVSQNLGWADRPGLLSVFKFIFNINEPFYYQASNFDPVSIWFVSIPLFLVIAIVTGIYFVNSIKKDENQTKGLYFPVIFIATPVLLAFCASWILPYSIWGTRHLIIAVAPYSIFLGMALSFGNQKIIGKVLQVLLILVLLTGFVLHVTRKNEPQIWCVWEEFAQDLSRKHSQEKTRIYVFEDLIAYQFWFSLRNNENFQIVKVNGISDITEDKAFFLPRGFDAVRTLDAEQINEGKVLIAFRAEEFNSLKQPLKYFGKRGFRINDLQTVETSGQKAFLVLMEK